MLALHAAYPARYPALLQSAAVGAPLGRYDILFAFPQAQLTLHANGQLSGPRAEQANNQFLCALDHWFAEEHCEHDAAVPFAGGWLLYLSYELAGQIEPRLHLPRAAQGPIAQAVRHPVALIHDHAQHKVYVALEPTHAECVAQIVADLASAPHITARATALIEGPVTEAPPEHYLDIVQRARRYIAAGDIYQANLAREWSATLAADVTHAELYARLRASNPGPFSSIVNLGDDHAVISSSPERLVAVRGREVATRPIAGTRPRGADVARDQLLIEELRAHPKEQAEHIMLLDLERNDLGRVCAPGTVEVDELMTIESYAHVHHIVSNVRGRLRADATPGQVLAAVFPGGTITGCPKVHCMEIIAELEQAPRGAYTGSLGYLNLNGDMDLNILIRTMQAQGSALSFRAGAGIVADSIPERELDETRAKAQGLLRALIAQDGL